MFLFFLIFIYLGEQTCCLGLFHDTDINQLLEPGVFYLHYVFTGDIFSVFPQFLCAKIIFGAAFLIWVEGPRMKLRIYSQSTQSAPSWPGAELQAHLLPHTSK